MASSEDLEDLTPPPCHHWAGMIYADEPREEGMFGTIFKDDGQLPEWNEHKLVWAFKSGAKVHAATAPRGWAVYSCDQHWDARPEEVVVTVRENMPCYRLLLARSLMNKIKEILDKAKEFVQDGGPLWAKLEREGMALTVIGNCKEPLVTVYVQEIFPVFRGQQALPQPTAGDLFQASRCVEQVQSAIASLPDDLKSQVIRTQLGWMAKDRQFTAFLGPAQAFRQISARMISKAELHVFLAEMYVRTACIGSRPVPVFVDGKQFVITLGENLNWWAQFEALRVLEVVVISTGCGSWSHTYMVLTLLTPLNLLSPDWTSCA